MKFIEKIFSDDFYNGHFWLYVTFFLDFNKRRRMRIERIFVDFNIFLF